MEPLFSNACVQTEQNLLEMTRASVPVWYRLYCRLLSAVMAVCAIVMVFMKMYMFTALFFALAVILAAVYEAKIRSAAKKSLKRNEELYGRDVETRIFFYEDTIIGKNLQSGTAVRTGYDKVKKIVETPSLYVLILDGNISVLVDKGGFISDNGAEFSKFIKEKCVNAK